MIALLCVARLRADQPSPRPTDGDVADESERESSPPPADVEVVSTGTRTPESAQRATVHTTLVTKEEAERRGATNVAEALQGEPNVQVNPSAYGSIGNPSAIQIQGLDRDRVLVLEDGERVIGGIDGAIDLSQLPLTDVQQIEVVTGPTSALYGTAALGGVVNVISGAPWRQGAPLITFTTPPSAAVPYRALVGPVTTSICCTSVSGSWLRSMAPSMPPMTRSPSSSTRTRSRSRPWI